MLNPWMPEHPFETRSTTNNALMKTLPTTTLQETLTHPKPLPSKTRNPTTTKPRTSHSTAQKQRLKPRETELPTGLAEAWEASLATSLP